MQITQIISYVTSILFFVLYFEKINRIGKTDLFLKYLFYLMLPFIICSDINGFTYHSEGISGYQIGNKFYLCYSNIFLATVYLLRYPLELKKHRRYIKLSLIHILVKEQIPDMPVDNILSEPEARNTAPCIAYACWKIQKKHPDANIVVTPVSYTHLDVYKRQLQERRRGRKNPSLMVKKDGMILENMLLINK